MKHQLLRTFVFLLLSLIITSTATAQVDCFGVEGGTAQPGTPCDNGNVNNTGFPDRWSVDCICEDYCPSDWTQPGYPGEPCDDGDPNTANDIWLTGCICAGAGVIVGDCNGVVDGTALPWTPCDDGDPLTTGEVWTAECVCTIVLDCEGVQNGTSNPGTACNDGDPNTFNEIWNSNCECQGGPNTISGQVYLDVDEDGTFGPDDLPILYRTVQLGPDGPYISSGSTGSFMTDVTVGSYILSAQNGGADTMGIAPVIVNFSGFEEVSSDNALPMFATSELVDLSVTLTATPPRPGFANNITVVCKNLGVLQESGELTLTFATEQSLIYNSPEGTITGNTVSWNIPLLGLGETITRLITVETPSSIPIGTGFIYDASIITTGTDGIPENNEQILHSTVVGSFDPNDKRVTPTSLTPTEVADGKPVEYTIRFQNTGTYPAEIVRIEDQLSEDLDLSSFEFLGSSHPCTWSIDNGMLEFLFEGIMLPDSNANEPESHGFVLFKITPNSDLQLSDVVENSAAIYFDFNEPIITEPAVFAVETSTGISDRISEEIKLWPNPSKGILHVEFKEAPTGELVILDMLGRPVHQQRISIGTTSMDISDLASGNYIVRIDSPERSYRSRFVKK